MAGTANCMLHLRHVHAKKNRQRVAVSKNAALSEPHRLVVFTSPGSARTCDRLSGSSHRSRLAPPVPPAEPGSRCSEQPKLSVEPAWLYVAQHSPRSAQLQPSSGPFRAVPV